MRTASGSAHSSAKRTAQTRTWLPTCDTHSRLVMPPLLTLLTLALDPEPMALDPEPISRGVPHNCVAPWPLPPPPLPTPPPLSHARPSCYDWLVAVRQSLTTCLCSPRTDHRLAWLSSARLALPCLALASLGLACDWACGLASLLAGLCLAACAWLVTWLGSGPFIWHRAGSTMGPPPCAASRACRTAKVPPQLTR